MSTVVLTSLTVIRYSGMEQADWIDSGIGVQFSNSHPAEQLYSRKSVVRRTALVPPIAAQRSEQLIHSPSNYPLCSRHSGYVVLADERREMSGSRSCLLLFLPIACQSILFRSVLSNAGVTSGATIPF